jgi:pimeloyl-ACP methyl ester carboxylesterase
LPLAANWGGEGEDLLVLLHGLGTTREVWTPLLDVVALNWPGRWLALDLPGHGKSPWLEDYAPARQAPVVAERIFEARPTGMVLLLGHSLGALIALELAQPQHGLKPERVLGLGLKTVWTDDELAAADRRATGPVRCFEDRHAAVDTYLKVAGLKGLVAADDPLALAGVRPRDGGWSLAMDPRANGVGVPAMAALSAAETRPFSLACGEHDRMADLADLRRWDRAASLIPGVGHSAMVESPAAVWRWVVEQLALETPEGG